MHRAGAPPALTNHHMDIVDRRPPRALLREPARVPPRRALLRAPPFSPRRAVVLRFLPRRVPPALLPRPAP